MLSSQVLFPQFLLYYYSYIITREEVKDESNRVSVSPFRVNNVAQTQATADKCQACPFFATAASVLTSESENIPFRPLVEEGKNKSVLKAHRRPRELCDSKSHCFRL